MTFKRLRFALKEFASGLALAAMVVGTFLWLVFSLLRTRTGTTVLLLAILLVSCQARAQGIPHAAQQYQRELTRAVQQEWGMNGQVALHAGQIHQESAWRPQVDSPVGAQGLSQFMPATSAWIVEIYPDLGRAAPYSPGWAMRAMTRYNRWHWQRIRDAADACERWAFTMSAYNGGLGWVNRDRRLAAADGADQGRWFGQVERYTARAGWAERENRHYVRRIILELEPRYRRAGWGGTEVCP